MGVKTCSLGVLDQSGSFMSVFECKFYNHILLYSVSYYMPTTSRHDLCLHIEGHVNCIVYTFIRRLFTRLPRDTHHRAAV